MVIVGSAWTVNADDAVTETPATVITISWVPLAREGTVHVSEVSLETETPVAAVPPMVTVGVPPPNPDPVMVTDVPTTPWVGETLAKLGPDAYTWVVPT